MSKYARPFKQKRPKNYMKTAFKFAARIFVAMTICAIVSACSQPAGIATGSFPSYGAQNAASAVTDSIIDSD
jgi:hypothetical protein